MPRSRFERRQELEQGHGPAPEGALARPPRQEWRRQMEGELEIARELLAQPAGEAAHPCRAGRLRTRPCRPSAGPGSVPPRAGKPRLPSRRRAPRLWAAQAGQEVGVASGIAPPILIGGEQAHAAGQDLVERRRRHRFRRVGERLRLVRRQPRPSAKRRRLPSTKLPLSQIACSIAASPTGSSPCCAA